MKMKGASEKRGVQKSTRGYSLSLRRKLMGEGFLGMHLRLQRVF